MAQVNLKQLEAFVQVARLGSFRRAAEKLNTTQPNISTRIAALEAQLDVTLMERDAGSVRLTPMGQTLLAKAKGVLHAHDDFLVAADNAQVFEGVLRLGVTEMIVHSWIGRYLSVLKAEFPNIDVELTVDLSVHLTSGLFDRSIDLALQSGPFGQQTTGMVDLGSFPFVWVASSALKLGGVPLSLTQLAEQPLLTHAPGTLPYEQLKAHIGQHADVTARLFVSTNIAACLQMTAEGLGVACLPEVMVREDLASGRLEQLQYDWLPDPLSFCARYHAEDALHLVSEAAKLARQVSLNEMPEDKIY